MTQPKIILGIETSCDETAAAVVQKDKDGVKILSNVVASSAQIQEKFGGVIPEQAAREQIKSIIPVIQEAIENCKLKIENLDAISVTYGPGLIGSLLVGVETAKVLAEVWGKPLIPVNHLLGHFYANWLTGESSIKSQESSKDAPRLSTLATSRLPQFPCIGLLVSGGHTDLLLFTGHGKYQYLGGTRDDAAGEAFDKTARLLGLPYPGGPAIAKLAKKGNPNTFDLPRPMIDSKDFDFSFSGLKTATANFLKDYEKTAKSRARKNAVQLSALQNPGISRHSPGAKQTPSERSGRANVFFSRDELANLAASIESAIVDVLVEKTVRAVQTYNIDQIIVAGGVAANQKLIEELRLQIENLKLKIVLHVPPPDLCTDNAAMIAAAAFFNYHPIDPLTLQANPNLALHK